jgi:hypothetical protein
MVLAGTTALVSGCDSLDTLTLFDTKTKLSGDRKPVFPEGVPGVTPGVPPEMVKGYREPVAEAPPAVPVEQPKAAEAKPKAAEAKPTPKPHAVQAAAKPKPAPAVQAQAAPPPAPATTATAPWPSQPQQPQQQQPQAQAPWPSAPVSR